MHMYKKVILISIIIIFLYVSLVLCRFKPVDMYSVINRDMKMYILPCYLFDSLETLMSFKSLIVMIPIP